jgi:hypothetical protein
VTEGEARLRLDIYRALIAVDVIGDPDQIEAYIDAVVEAVKKQWVYVNCGEILSVTWDNCVDFEDSKTCYSLWAESSDIDEEADWDEEDD